MTTSSFGEVEFLFSFEGADVTRGVYWQGKIRGVNFEKRRLKKSEKRF